MSGVHGEAALRAVEHAIRGALAAWLLSPATRVELLNVSENATFLLHDPEDDRRLVLRVHRPGYRTEAEIRSELVWIVALREQATVATPAAIAGADGRLIQQLRVARWGAGTAINKARYAVAFEYVAGTAPPHAGDRSPWFQTLGAITARLHLHARAWTPPAGFTRRAWDFPTMLGERAVWGDWRAGLGLDRAGAALLERVAAYLRDRLARLGRSPDRFGLIHADLRLANLIVADQALSVLDFDDCGFGWLGYDFAASVSFFEDDPGVSALLAAWLAGYRAVTPFPREDEADIPAFIMLRRLLLLAWIASHRDAPTARELGSAYAGGTLALADDFLRRYG